MNFFIDKKYTAEIIANDVVLITLTAKFGLLLKQVDSIIEQQKLGEDAKVLFHPYK